MLGRVTSRQQVTLSTEVLDELGIEPGDEIELLGVRDGYLLKPKPEPTPKREIDYSKLGLLHDKIKPGTLPFDICKFRDDRENGRGPALRY